MEPNVDCQLCGCALVSRFDEVLDPQSGEAFEIRSCPACGHGQTLPVPNSLDRYYGQQYHGGRHGRTADYCGRRRIRLVTKAAGTAAGRKLLDVGCGDGTFLLKAQQAGWQVSGTELNPELARDAGLDVYGSLADATAAGPFDCITVWHVLEHFVQPLAELEKMAKLLTAEGTLVVAVPNADGTQARVCGRKWLHLDVPRHLHHFGRRSLERHLGQAGFQAQLWWHGEFEYDLLGWSQSGLNWLLPTPNVFFELLMGRRATMPRRARTFHLALGIAACALALLPTWWGMATGRAGTLLVAAKRRRAPQ